MSETVLKIGERGSVSWVLRVISTEPRSTTFFSWVNESPPVAKPMMPMTTRTIPIIVTGFMKWRPFRCNEQAQPAV